MKRLLATAAAILLLGAGLILVLYPTISDWFISRNATRAIQDYQETVEGMDPELKQQHLDRAVEYNQMLNGSKIKDPFIPDSGFVIPQEYESILNINGMIGTIEIPRINVFLPIYHGTSEAVLQKGVGHMEATAFPVGGTSNHVVLTGHRGLPSAKLFTDLDQLEEGDKFFIHVLDETLAYAVNQIKVIEPSETEDLRPAQGEDYVTLITCTPYAINSHRLLIRGTRVPYSSADLENELEKWSFDIDWRMVLIIIFTVFWMIFLAVRFLRRRRKHKK